MHPSSVLYAVENQKRLSCSCGGGGGGGFGFLRGSGFVFHHS